MAIDKRSKLRKIIDKKKCDLVEVKACRDSQMASANARAEALEEVIKDLEAADATPVKKRAQVNESS